MMVKTMKLQKKYPWLFLKKIVAVSRIKSISEKYILTDYLQGRWIYWEYRENYEDIKHQLIK